MFFYFSSVLLFSFLKRTFSCTSLKLLIFLVCLPSTLGSQMHTAALAQHTLSPFVLLTNAFICSGCVYGHVWMSEHSFGGTSVSHRVSPASKLKPATCLAWPVFCFLKMMFLCVSLASYQAILLPHPLHSLGPQACATAPGLPIPLVTLRHPTFSS